MTGIAGSGLGDLGLVRVETFVGQPVLVMVIDVEAPAAVRVEEVRGAGHGAVALLPRVPNGRQAVFRYVPQTGFVGVDGFGYRLTGDAPDAMRWVEVRVRAVNGPPVAVADMVVVAGDGPVTFDVLANDDDPDGDALRITGFTMPQHGRLTLGSDQLFTYWPGPGFFGQDSFTYTIRDVRDPGDPQMGESTAVVTLVAPVVVPPVNTPPLAGRDAVVTPRDTAVSIPVLANATDPDGDPLRVVGLTLPRHGTVALEPDQTVTYTPEPGFTGIDDFTYIVDDGRGGRDTGIIAVTVTE